MCVISLGAGGDAEHSWGTKCAEHRLYPAAILALDEALTAAESNENVRAVVLTAEGKYFCNGFDLRFLQQETQMMDDVQRATEKLCSRILSFPKPTVAAVNGHACAAGAMLMLCFDEIVMNSERGYCFVPGIDLGLTYSPGMAALMAARLPFAIRHSFIVMGKRMTRRSSPSTPSCGAPSAVLPTALARAIDSTEGDARHRCARSRHAYRGDRRAGSRARRGGDGAHRPMGFSNIPTGVDKPVAKAKTPVGSPRGDASPSRRRRRSQSRCSSRTPSSPRRRRRRPMRKWASTRKTASQLNLRIWTGRVGRECVSSFWHCVSHNHKIKTVTHTRAHAPLESSVMPRPSTSQRASWRLIWKETTEKESAGSRRTSTSTSAVFPDASMSSSSSISISSHWVRIWYHGSCRYAAKASGLSDDAPLVGEQ